MNYNQLYCRSFVIVRVQGNIHFIQTFRDDASNIFFSDESKIGIGQNAFLDSELIISNFSPQSNEDRYSIYLILFHL